MSTQRFVDIRLPGDWHPLWWDDPYAFTRDEAADDLVATALRGELVWAEAPWPTFGHPELPIDLIEAELARREARETFQLQVAQIRREAIRRRRRQLMPDLTQATERRGPGRPRKETPGCLPSASPSERRAVLTKELAHALNRRDELDAVIAYLRQRLEAAA